MAFSQDSKRLLLGCADGTLQLLDIDTLSEIYRLKGCGARDFAIWSVAIFKDGKRALSGTNEDFSIREWDLEREVQLRCFQGKHYVTSLSISPDEKSFFNDRFQEC